MTAHRGEYGYHADDCLCGGYGYYCNRNGRVWSCCGSCKEDSDCSAPHMHPTYWNHPMCSTTIAGHERNWPVYKTNEAIRALFPHLFGEHEPPSRP